MWYVAATRDLERLSGLEKNSIRTLGGGGGGYGTLQELLLLKQLKQKISPDLLVLQFSATDFMDNHLGVASYGILRSQIMRRPYYTADGTIKYSTARLRGFGGHPRQVRARYSTNLTRLFRFLQFRYYHDYYLPNSPELAAAYHKEILAVTSDLLKKIRAELPNIPAVMVNCCAKKDGPNGQWENLGTEAGFTTFQPSDTIERNKEQEIILFRRLSPKP